MPFREDLISFFEKQEQGFSLLQKKAWDRFLQIGLPNRKDAAFAYLPLTRIYERNFNFEKKQKYKPTTTLYIYPEHQKACIVFVDGQLKKELSNLEQCDGVELLSSAEANQKFSTFLYNRFTKALTLEKDAFALLNAAAACEKQGAFLFVNPNAQITTLQVLFLTTQEESFVFPRLQIFGGKHSSLNLVFRQIGKQNSLTNTFLDCALECGAKIKLNWIEECEWESGILFHVRATLKEKSFFESTTATAGGSLSRHDYHIALEGEDAECSLSGAFSLKNRCEHHAHTFIHHQAPHTRSRQKFKGVLDGFARSSFGGMIFVDPEAQKTEAYQANNNLLLSEKAFAYARPNLEIFADDVKASHGATIGQISEEELFYLQARGIDEISARRLLVRGFTREIIEHFFSVPSKHLAYALL